MNPLLRERLFGRLVIDPCGCVLWTGARTKGGYGRIRVDGKDQYVHRVMWLLLVGPIPEGTELDHVKTRGCLYKHCANVDHLEPVSHRENILRGASFAAAHAAVTHCPSQHEYDDANTMIGRDGQRRCRACRNARNRQRNRTRLREEESCA